jgi:hypothetical protein
MDLGPTASRCTTLLWTQSSTCNFNVFIVYFTVLDTRRVGFRGSVWCVAVKGILGPRPTWRRYDSVPP